MMSSNLAASIRKTGVLASLLFVVTGLANAQDVRFRDGRFLETLGGVSLQRADEAGSDEAVRNMPFLPGDRVWTDQEGRAEIVFAEGEVLWIAERSKVDSLGRGGAEQDERLGLRVFAGSFVARVRGGGPGFEFHAPGGNLTTTGAARFRVDVKAGETTLSVVEGEVLSDLAGRRLMVRAGEQVRYRDGDVEGPIRYQRAAADYFDRWCDDRDSELERMARAHNDERLPDELDAYGDELDRNGEWVYDQPQGYVYVPRVANDWAPYTYGRWVYTLYGWTWVADEPWGFVTSHYGRWGYTSRLGWHWLPRSGFAGAWVGWSTPVGSWSNTIGWCALGFNDRPVGALYGSGGRAVARADFRSSGPARGWSFANRSDMGRASIHRRRVDIPAEEAQRAVVWNPSASPDRDFREGRRGVQGRASRPSGVAEGVGAVARGQSRGGGAGTTGPRIYVRPSPGDSTPELRSDPTTTIPSPESRRGKGIGQDGFKDEQDNRKSRSRMDEAGIVLDRSGAPMTWESARTRTRERNDSSERTEQGASSPRAGSTTGSTTGSTDEATRSESARERPTRDPLLSRFFRSITSPSAESARESNPNRSDDSAARRREREPQPRDEAAPRSRDREPRREEPSAREASPRERSRPTEARPSGDQNRERTRPAGVERSQPRNSPPPERSPRGGGSEEGRAGRHRPSSDR